MLALTRKPGQRLFIGDDIIIEVVRVHGGAVRLAIQAPDAVNIHREEIAPPDHPLLKKPQPQGSK